MAELECFAFRSLDDAVGFLDECASTPGAWGALVRASVVQTGVGPRPWRIELPAELVRFDQTARLKRNDGEPCPAGTQAGAAGPVKRFPARELFVRVPLPLVPVQTPGRALLVVPEGFPPGDCGWIEILAALEGWAAFSLTLSEPSPWPVLFLLRPLDASPRLPDLAPELLYASATAGEQYFIPLGREHPLAEAYPSLMPPSDPGTLHLWTQEATGELCYRRLSLSNKPRPLRHLVLVEPPAGAPARLTAGYGGEQIELGLRPRLSSAAAAVGTPVVYRFDSRKAEAPPVLLRFLDLAEAGIEAEELRYFSDRPSLVQTSDGTGDGEHGDLAAVRVRHYVVAPRPLEDEGLWPGLHRYDRAIRLGNTPLLVHRDYDLVPSLAGLLAAPQAEDFVDLLAKGLGFDKDEKDLIVLIEPRKGDSGGGGGPRWGPVRLEGSGERLDRMITLRPQIDRDSVRRLVDVARIKLGPDRRRYEKKWIAAGRATADEMVQATGHLLDGLATGLDWVEKETGRQQSLLPEVRELLDATNQRLSQVPPALDAFIRDLMDLLSRVTGPRQAWNQWFLTTVEQVLRALNGHVAVLRDDTDRRVAEAEEQVSTALASLRALQTRLAARLPGLAQSVTTLEATQTTADAELAAARANLVIWRRDLGARTAVIERRTRCCEARSAALDRRTARLDTLDKDLSAWEGRVNDRQQELNERVAALKRRAASDQAAQQLVHATAIEVSRLRVQAPAQARRFLLRVCLLVRLSAEMLSHWWLMFRQWLLKNRLKNAIKALRRHHDQVRHRLETLEREVSAFRTEISPLRDPQRGSAEDPSGSEPQAGDA